MEQNMKAYTVTDEWVWKTLFTRQIKQLQNFACEDYLVCVKKMYRVLNPHFIPDFEKLNEWFEDHTGWKIEVVAGLIPVEDFFKLLAQKRFCSSTWLRSPDSLDYLEEPDMFHDIFGHIPLLAHPVFSDFAHEFGKLGVKLKDNPEAIIALQRLYWYTIEFGIIKEDKLRIYGAGILSSYGETPRSVSVELKQTAFDIKDVLNKAFRTDVMQDEYVVIDSFQQLFDSIKLVEDYFSKLPTNKSELITAR
jgi:phenylalanine-4-hydroxylase